MQHRDSTILPDDEACIAKLAIGLDLLRQASRYADCLACNAWEFAVEITTLRAAELTNNEFRWMVHHNWVDHAEETTAARAKHRSFGSSGTLNFTDRTCFVLTSAGIDAASRLYSLDPLKKTKHVSTPTRLSFGEIHNTLQQSRPTWDHVKRQLRFGGAVIKTYKLPSPNQECVLSAFEEEGWQERIFDPLPPSGGIVTKRRLHDTIKSLNRHHRRRLIRFKGDGTGEGVCWEVALPRDSLQIRSS